MLPVVCCVRRLLFAKGAVCNILLPITTITKKAVKLVLITGCKKNLTGFNCALKAHECVTV